MAERQTYTERKGDVGLKERNVSRTRKPRLFQVIIHNDDYTPIEFVVVLVVEIFRKTHEEAAHLALEVHNSGSGVAGVYTHEIAETKRMQAEMRARSQDHPLMLSMEPVS